LRGPLQALIVAAALLPPGVLFGAAPSAPDLGDEPPSLAGQFLIATPGMRDPRFAETVLVVVRHNKDGAFALVVNRPAGAQPTARLLEALGVNSEGASGTVPIFIGGPVQPEHAFVLHSTDYRDDTTLMIGSGVAMTASAGVLRAIAAGSGPKKSILAFGYAGWAPGQLEGELKQQAWYTAPMDARLLFDEDRERVWQLAVERRPRDL
jgi:putative transcriptional regulator